MPIIVAPTYAWPRPYVGPFTPGAGQPDPKFGADTAWSTGFIAVSVFISFTLASPATITYNVIGTDTTTLGTFTSGLISAGVPTTQLITLSTPGEINYIQLVGISNDMDLTVADLYASTAPPPPPPPPHLAPAAPAAPVPAPPSISRPLSPVVVARIQNRRGTQDQFNSLYPGPYTSAPSATSSGSTVTVTSTVGVYENGTPGIIAGTGAFAPGSTVTAILSSTQFTVSTPPLTPLSGGAQVFIPRYHGQGGLNVSKYPNVLLPGEIALCTDTRNLYIGNINGEYILYTASNPVNLSLPPMVITLAPAATYTVIPELTYQATPFFNLLYDVTDSASPDWNSVTGTSFARNGEMKITAVQSFADIPNLPYPPITAADLIDTNVEVKNPATYSTQDVSFIAQFSGPDIEILYKHNFGGTLTLSSTTIRWLPF